MPRLSKVVKEIPPIILGADPEFIMEKNGVVVKATHLVRNAFCGFGADGGSSSIGELRPGYSDNILELVAKLEKTMKMGNSRLGLDTKTDKWLSGHYKQNRALGGHIHIRSKSIDTTREDGYSNLGALLDFYLEDCLEDLIAPPGERRARIASSSYGKKHKESSDAIRAQSEDRIEYRAPGSWLLTPKIAYAYLYTAKAAATLDALKITAKSILGQSGSNELVDEKVDYLLEMGSLIQGRVKVGKDMLLGAEILDEVIHEIPDWDQDFRINWI